MQKTFGEVVLFARTGLNPRTNFKLGQGNNKYITIKNIHNNSLIVDDSTDVVDDDALAMIHRRSQIKAGDVLFCSIGRIGDMYIIEEEPVGWDVNESVFVFTLNTAIIRQKYFYYLFKHRDIIEYLTANSSGSTFKSIKMNQLQKMVFDLPSLEEQDKIVSCLDAAADVIDSRQHQLRTLDTLIKARFVEMFGAENEFAKWPCCTVADVAEVTVGVVIQPTQYYCERGVPAFRSLNVREMRVNDNDWVYFSEEGHARNQKSVIRENDVLVVRSGAPGVACVASAKYAGYNAVDIIIAHPDMEKINPVFLAMFTNMPHGMNQIRVKTGGAAQQHYNVGGYKSLQIMLPPLELQKQFAAFVSQVDKSKVVVQAALDKAQTLFDSLMQQYFG